MNYHKTSHERSTVLFCPLDWGLGHIARDLPLIKEFHARGYQVIVAASPTLSRWLKTEFPEVKITAFPGPKISYGKKGFSFLKFIFSLPQLFMWPFRERRITRKLVNEFHPSLIISDNRYGARDKNVFSVIITHQLMIKMPGLLKWLEPFLHYLITSLINKFDECWIPDFSKKKSLAGDLVHKYRLPLNHRLIGPLSRFESQEKVLSQRKLDKDSVLAIISGPEPQKSILEKLLIKKFSNNKGHFKLYNGNLGVSHQPYSKKITINGHCSTEDLREEILNHCNIISRSGYSTIMDMYTLGKSCLLIPTPGQPEQEYLAKFHKKRTHSIIEQGKLKSINGQLTFPSACSWQPKTLIFREKLKDFF